MNHSLLRMEPAHPELIFRSEGYELKFREYGDVTKQKHFATAFRQKFHTQPKEYRKRDIAVLKFETKPVKPLALK